MLESRIDDFVSKMKVKMLNLNYFVTSFCKSIKTAVQAKPALKNSRNPWCTIEKLKLTFDIVVGQQRPRFDGVVFVAHHHLHTAESVERENE
jgi:hypothetical protein